MGNCIYIDAEQRWWIAKAEVFNQGGEITLIKDAEDFKTAFHEGFVKYVNGFAPTFLFFDEEGQWYQLSAESRKVIPIT